MKTGFRGTFVISWSQTELDGLWSAPLSSLRVGTAWTWTGETVRVDGPAGVLPLGDATGEADLRKRAAHSVRKLLKAVEADTNRLDQIDIAAPMFEAGFTVTDGRDTWTITLINVGPGKPPLAMFVGEIPPRQTDLWVVSHTIDARERESQGDLTGGVICFTPGTMILTDNGPRPVEEIGEGDRVQTKDNGYEAVLWVGSRRLTGARLYAMPHLRPIRLSAGALDHGVPDAGLLVSPDHRMVLRGPRARSLFNCDEVLVTARDLLNDRTVVTDYTARDVTYIHMLLPRHQIVFANAVETESFHPASAALATMDPAQLADLEARLPAVTSDPQSYGAYARRVLSVSEAAILQHDFGIGQTARRMEN
jgi:hypothetical protein